MFSVFWYSCRGLAIAEADVDLFGGSVSISSLIERAAFLWTTGKASQNIIWGGELLRLVQSVRLGCRRRFPLHSGTPRRVDRTQRADSRCSGFPARFDGL